MCICGTVTHDECVRCFKIGLPISTSSLFVIQAGARIVVHDRNIFPLVSENGIDATPSNAMNIGIHEVLAIHISISLLFHFSR